MPLGQSFNKVGRSDSTDFLFPPNIKRWRIDILTLVSGQQIEYHLKYNTNVFFLSVCLNSFWSKVTFFFVLFQYQIYAIFQNNFFL